MNRITLITALFCLHNLGMAQLPDPAQFNTAANGLNAKLFPGTLDTNWQVALGDLSNPTTPFVPSLVVGQCYSVWYPSPFVNADWIAYDFGAFCDHTGKYDFYYRRKITLPATNTCGAPIGQGFCMAMDFYADNFVSEITINGIVNYSKTNPDPYYYLGYVNPETVNLCNGWQPGENEMIVHIQSAAPAAGFLAHVNLNVVQTPFVTYSIDKTICHGTEYEGHSTTGIFADTFPSNGLNDCDSIRFLFLTVLPLHAGITSRTICAGEQYEGHSTTGIFMDTLAGQASTGCDSIRILDLKVISPKLETITTNICPGETYDGYDRSGIFTDTLFAQASTGCDSIRILHLTVLPVMNEAVEVTICPGGQYAGYSLPGVYVDTLFGQGLNGCDSIRTLQLSVVPDQISMYVPNAFSPNDDGDNDCIQPLFAELNFSSYRFSVFDRWGNNVYSTENPGDCWNGEFRGKMCPPDVYVYFVEMVTAGFCSSRTYKGDITLIR